MIFNVIFWRCNHYPFRYPMSSYNPNLLYHDDEIHSYPAGCSSLEVMHHGKCIFSVRIWSPIFQWRNANIATGKDITTASNLFMMPAIHSNLSYQFGNGEMAHFGPVNEVSARNARLFQGITGFYQNAFGIYR